VRGRGLGKVVWRGMKGGLGLGIIMTTLFTELGTEEVQWQNHPMKS